MSTTRTAKKKKPARRQQRYWSHEVTERSNALDLEPSIFSRDARQIARSLKRSAEQSKRRKASPFRSAMSMLSFYANRAGRKLSPARRRVIVQAKEELRKLFNRPTAAAKKR